MHLTPSIVVLFGVYIFKKKNLPRPTCSRESPYSAVLADTRALACQHVLLQVRARVRLGDKPLEGFS